MSTKILFVFSRFVIFQLVLSIGFCTLAEDEQSLSDPDISTRKKNKRIVARQYQKALKDNKGNDDILVLPALVADRIKKTVIVQVETTGLGISGSPPEFFIIFENSGHDYESLMVSFARPGDIHRALEFIGMEPGRPVNSAKLEFWPKGERVLAQCRCYQSPALADPVDLDDLLVDVNTKQPTREKGFVFTGSLWVESNTNGMVYAADAFEPKSIVANYNEPYSVLDVPRIAPQGDVYRTFVVNTNYIFPEGALVEVTFKPEYPGEKKRVVDVSLLATQNDSDNIFFKLTATGADNLETEKLSSMLEYFRKMRETGHDPFVEIRFDKNLEIGKIKSLCRVLADMETRGGIRIEPPPDGQLYYKAFIPDESFRERGKRPAQPWELHLKPTKDGIAAKLIEIEQIWKEGEIWPDLKITNHTVSSGSELKIKLNEIEAMRKELGKKEGLPVILVYSQSKILYGELMGYLNNVIKDYPVIHIFLDQENVKPATEQDSQ